MPKFRLTVLPVALTLLLAVIAFGLTTADADQVPMKAVTGQSVGKQVNVPVARRGFPVVITGTQFTPAQPKAGGRVSLRVELHNTSKQAVGAFAVELRRDTKKHLPGVMHRARIPVRGLQAQRRKTVVFTTVQLPSAVVATPTRVSYRVTIMPVSGGYLPGTTQRSGAHKLVSVIMPGQQRVLTSKRPGQPHLKGQTAPVTAIGRQPVTVKGGKHPSSGIMPGQQRAITSKRPGQSHLKGQIAPVTAIGRQPVTVKGDKRPSQALFAVVDGKLDVNGSTGPLTITVGGTATVNWKTITTLPSSPPVTPTGVHLLVHNAPMPADNCSNTPPATGSPDSGYKPGAPGGTHTLSMTNPYYVLGTTYYVKGCIFNQDQLGVRTYTGFETNTVVVKYEEVPKPDLVVTKVGVENLNNNASRIVSTVKNIGSVTKPRLCTLLRPEGCVGRSMNFHVRLIDSSGGSSVISEASLIDMVELRPGGEFLQPLSQAVTGEKFHIVACINENRMQAETSYTNNCKRAIVYPNVTVTLTSIDVHDDGDNLTKGDWIVFLYIPSNYRPYSAKRWPTSGSRNVDSGSTITPNITIKQNLYSSKSLRFNVGVIDCDHKGIGGFVGDLVDGFDVSGLPPLPAYNCSGEEVIEDNGKEEYAIEEFSIPTYQWQAGTRTVSRRVKKDGLDFTVHLRIGTTPLGSSGRGTPAKPGDHGRPPTHRK